LSLARRGLVRPGVPTRDSTATTRVFRSGAGGPTCTTSEGTWHREPLVSRRGGGTVVGDDAHAFSGADAPQETGSPRKTLGPRVRGATNRLVPAVTAWSPRYGTRSRREVRPRPLGRRSAPLVGSDRDFEVRQAFPRAHHAWAGADAARLQVGRLRAGRDGAGGTIARHSGSRRRAVF
jgi:hypothetical protein